MKRKMCMIAFCMAFLLTGCGVTLKDKAELKLSEKDAVKYYADKYGETAKVASSEFHSYLSGGVGLPSFTTYDTDCRIYTLDNGVTVVYDQEKDLFFDDRQADVISSDIAKKVLPSIIESTGWNYKIVYPGEEERIGFTQCYARQAFHAYYDGDIWNYIENADADIFNYYFYKIYFRMNSGEDWEDTFDRFQRDMDAINGLNYVQCFGVWSYDNEDAMESVTNRVWSYDKAAKLPLTVNNSFAVGDVQVYFNTYGRSLEDADRAAILIEDVSSMIPAYNDSLSGYKMHADGMLYRVQMDIDFGKYNIDWNNLTKNFVYSGNEGILTFGKDSDGDMKSARFSTGGEWEYFPLNCGNEFFVYQGTFDR